jgi:hypothetical protein
MQYFNETHPLFTTHTRLKDSAPVLTDFAFFFFFFFEILIFIVREIGSVAPPSDATLISNNTIALITPLPPARSEIRVGRERLRLSDGGVSIYAYNETNSVINWDVCFNFFLLLIVYFLGTCKQTCVSSCILWSYSSFSSSSHGWWFKSKWKQSK